TNFSFRGGIELERRRAGIEFSDSGHSLKVYASHELQNSSARVDRVGRIAVCGRDLPEGSAAGGLAPEVEVGNVHDVESLDAELAIDRFLDPGLFDETHVQVLLPRSAKIVEV